MKVYKQNWRDKKTTFLFFAIWAPLSVIPLLAKVDWVSILVIPVMYFMLYRILVFLDSVNIEAQYRQDHENFHKENPEIPVAPQILVLRNMFGYYLLFGSTRGKTFFSKKKLVEYYNNLQD